MASALDDLILFKGRRVMSAILAQAADRGEIPGDRDWSLVAEVIVAMGLLRAVSRQPVDADFVRQVINTLVLPAITCASDAAEPDRRQPADPPG